ncbi:basic proline-rich protein-like [Penaeus japonicus]|uniref:basic proline-rich protein-like n=1 Tax=Penaeus japonicus TaxID=27405 RepID=UPI001C713696|nr:basic proline-rich protein-like [Penaeus japonicus]
MNGRTPLKAPSPATWNGERTGRQAQPPFPGSEAPATRARRAPRPEAEPAPATGGPSRSGGAPPPPGSQAPATRDRPATGAEARTPASHRRPEPDPRLERRQTLQEGGAPQEAAARPLRAEAEPAPPSHGEARAGPAAREEAKLKARQTQAAAGEEASPYIYPDGWLGPGTAPTPPKTKTRTRAGGSGPRPAHLATDERPHSAQGALSRDPRPGLAPKARATWNGERTGRQAQPPSPGSEAPATRARRAPPSGRGRAGARKPQEARAGPAAREEANPAGGRRPPRDSGDRRTAVPRLAGARHPRPSRAPFGPRPSRRPQATGGPSRTRGSGGGKPCRREAPPKRLRRQAHRRSPARRRPPPATVARPLRAEAEPAPPSHRRPEPDPRLGRRQTLQEGGAPQETPATGAPPFLGSEAPATRARRAPPSGRGRAGAPKPQEARAGPAAREEANPAGGRRPPRDSRDRRTAVPRLAGARHPRPPGHGGRGQDAPDPQEARAGPAAREEASPAGGRRPPRDSRDRRTAVSPARRRPPPATARPRGPRPGRPRPTGGPSRTRGSGGGKPCRREAPPKRLPRQAHRRFPGSQAPATRDRPATGAEARTPPTHRRPEPDPRLGRRQALQEGGAPQETPATGAPPFPRLAGARHPRPPRAPSGRGRAGARDPQEARAGPAAREEAKLKAQAAAGREPPPTYIRTAGKEEPALEITTPQPTSQSYADGSVRHTGPGLLFIEEAGCQREAPLTTPGRRPTADAPREPAKTR